MNQETNWDEVNRKKRLEIMIGQAVNLANQAALNDDTEALNEITLQGWFDFYFAFLQKQYNKVLPAQKATPVIEWETMTSKEKDVLQEEKKAARRNEYQARKDLFDKKLSEQHVENMNWEE